MTDYTPGSNNRGDLEYDKFGENAAGEVAVRVLDGTKDSSGVELSATLTAIFNRQEELLMMLSNDIRELLTHIRYISGLGVDPDNEQVG